MKLGLIVFCNDSGLGSQTRRLTYMLKPDRLLAIDSTPFSKNKDQHFDWYSAFSGYRVHGFPTNREIKKFLIGLTHVLVCENPLNYFLLTEAKRLGIKVYIQSNFEFCDHLDKPLTPPHKFLMPSYWKVQDMISRFGEDVVAHLPPPIDANEFKKAREINMSRSGTMRLLHIVGTLAAHDRNGTLDVIKALNHTKTDFQLVIKSQHELPIEYMVDDRRVRYQIGNELDVEKLYTDFDAVLLPRRYGGLSLTCNEALMSGLPVIMTDISPNNQLLPKEWLVRSEKRGQFQTRTMIDIYGASPVALAQKIDWLSVQDSYKIKIEAFAIGYENFNYTVLRPKYEALWLQ